MSEWLTTGLAIDRLEKGEIAINETNDKMFWNGANELEIESANGRIYNFVGIELKGMKWRILPQYVSFEEAMKSLVEGKTIKCWYETSDTPWETCNINSEFEITEQEVRNAKWSVEYDS